jgi:hypothetical protein
MTAGGGREVGEDGDVRSIRPIVPHKLERVDEEDDNQNTGQEQQREQEQRERQEEERQPRPDDEEEEGRRRVELDRPRTPEPMGLGMTHIPMEGNEEPRRRSSPRSYSVIDQLFE